MMVWNEYIPVREYIWLIGRNTVKKLYFCSKYLGKINEHSIQNSSFKVLCFPTIVVSKVLLFSWNLAHLVLFMFWYGNLFWSYSQFFCSQLSVVWLALPQLFTHHTTFALIYFLILNNYSVYYFGLKGSNIIMVLKSSIVYNI